VSAMSRRNGPTRGLKAAMRCAATVRSRLHSAATIGAEGLDEDDLPDVQGQVPVAALLLQRGPEPEVLLGVVSIAGPRESRSPGSDARRSTLGHDIRRSLTNTLMPGSRVNRPLVTPASLRNGAASSACCSRHFVSGSRQCASRMPHAAGRRTVARHASRSAR